MKFVVRLGRNKDDDQALDSEVSVDSLKAGPEAGAAWNCGVRYFDTARSYGRGEAFLGDWLRARQIPADAVTVASKWGYTYTADWRINAKQHEVKEHSLPVLQRQWQETQANLGGYLSLYQIHSATLDSGVLANSAVHAELARLKGAGTRSA